MSVPVGSASPSVFQPLTPAHSHPLFSRLFPVSSSSFSLILFISFTLLSLPSAPPPTSLPPLSHPSLSSSSLSPLSLSSTHLPPRLLLRTSTVFAFQHLYPTPPTVPQIFQTTFAQNALVPQNPCRKPLTPEKICTRRAFRSYQSHSLRDVL